jgi:hypothetical protein
MRVLVALAATLSAGVEVDSDGNGFTIDHNPRAH